MPNYDWLCQSCQTEFEQVVKYDDRDKLVQCPTCEQETAMRVYRRLPTELKASFPDGHKREGWADLRATARLQEIKANAKNKEDRLGALKELDERGEKIREKVRK